MKSGSIFQRIVIGVLCLAVISYTVYHLANLFSEEISTIVAGSSVEQTVLSFNGYVFRDETVLSSSYSGAIDYSVKNGTKVAAGEQLATVYEQGNLNKVRDTVAILDRQIEILEASTSGTLNMSEITQLKETVSDEYYSIVKMLASGKTSSLSGGADAMLVAMNRIDLLTNEKTTVKDTLETLRATRQSYINAGGNSEKIYADRSGYFYSGVDGYEDVFTMETAENMTSGEFYKLISKYSTSSGTSSVCKLSYDSSWRYAVGVTAEEAKYFEEGADYTVELEGNITASVKMTLGRTVKSDSGKGAVLVFDCDRLPEGFVFTRAISSKIVVDSVAGIYVPRTAVHLSGKTEGVYILRGSVVLFRNIKVLYEGSDYYIVADGVEADGNDIYLQSNDLLITGGTNLFDGRILD